MSCREEAQFSWSSNSTRSQLHGHLHSRATRLPLSLPAAPLHLLLPARLVRRRELYLWVLCLHFRFEIWPPDARTEAKLLAVQSVTVSSQHPVRHRDVSGGSGWPRRDHRQLWPCSCWKQITVGKHIRMGTKLYAMPIRSDLPPQNITAAQTAPGAALAPLHTPQPSAWVGAEHGSNVGSDAGGRERLDSKRAITAAPLQQKAVMQRN